jgi:hypothetical protein
LYARTHSTTPVKRKKKQREKTKISKNSTLFQEMSLLVKDMVLKNKERGTLIKKETPSGRGSTYAVSEPA